MKLKNLSDQILLENLNSLVKREREITLEVLHHLREVERRHLFAELGYSSLFEYAVKELKYSEGSAGRRIASMRLLKEMPELEEKIESGSITLSALSQAGMFFRKEAIKHIDEKKEVIMHLENKSAREVERELVSRSTDPVRLLPEKLRAVSTTHTELRLLIEDKLVNEIEELRNLLSHAHPGASIKDVLAVSVQIALKKLRPQPPKVKQNERAEAPELLCTATPASEPARAKSAASRYIPQHLKKTIWQRDEGECTYKSPEGRKCGCKHALELDHIIPFALGGTHTEENLRLRCRAHNQLAGIKSFGEKKMQCFLPGLN